MRNRPCRFVLTLFPLVLLGCQHNAPTSTPRGWCYDDNACTSRATNSTHERSACRALVGREGSWRQASGPCIAPP